MEHIKESKMIKFALDKPKQVIRLMLLFMFVCAAFIPFIKIDTDPENMLSHDEPVRVMHDQLKDKFDMHDMVVVGIVNDEHTQGVFNQASLTEVYDLSTFIETLNEQNESGEMEGVVSKDLMTPTKVDYIETLSKGEIKFDWLMKRAPNSEAEALAIKERLMNNELFYNTMVSEDGKALALYLPITSKDVSYGLRKKLQQKIDGYTGKNEYHITGLPVAEDTFGVEMFIQMAISAPAAMLLIFVLMMLFFKKLKVVLSPLIVAMVSVICTMGLLIATGNTVHIMSSMIPIFIMPIAVLDSVHILSEFYDRYQMDGDRRKTLEHVISELFRPMLFTSFTSAAGFASLAITPIPPVQVFGVFVAFGILLAWFLTMVFVPAFIMLMPEDSLKDFGHKSDSGDGGLLRKALSTFQSWTYNKAKMVIILIGLMTLLCAYGVTKININDNPVKWFTKSHPIRVADKALNKHFGGTYMAYLNFESNESTTFSKSSLLKQLSLAGLTPEEMEALKSGISSLKIEEESNPFESISDYVMDIADGFDADEQYEKYEMIADEISLMGLEQSQVFKRPEVLNYILKLEDYLQAEGGVGKSNSISKIVRNINKKLNEDDEAFNVIPKDVSGVGQGLLSYQNSHVPHMLWHFVSRDYKSANLWLQLKSGDNQDMEKTIAAVESYMIDNPPPVKISKNWFGLTYINVIWQKKMVKGMLEAFLGSFAVVFLMMILLFRSVKWASLSMIPLTLTILIIYGVIGWIGKDYDMPVAVLSSLALGLAIDFAIHFLVRSRDSLSKTNDWAVSSKFMFGEPSRAILRNMIVIAIGFLPLLLATLIPYRTVGLILASILFLSGIVTLLLLPALIKVLGLNK